MPTPATPVPPPTPASPPQGALFVSKSVATHQVIGENTAFSQVIQLKNIGPAAWAGYTLVRVPLYGPAKKATDSLSAQTDCVAVPNVKPGEVASITLNLKAIKSNPKSGAAQSSPWELRQSNGTKVPIMIDATTQATGGDVWTTITINPAAAAGVPDLRNAAYTDSASNKYLQIGNDGQCTAFVYARIKEKLGIMLEKVPGSTFGCNSAGQKWIDQLTGTGKPYTLSQTPRQNAVAVWALTADQNQGHVSFVESVDATGNVTLSEANVTSYGSFASDNGPDSDTWGGGYDGKPKIVTTPVMVTRMGPRYVFKGYIYIG